MYLQRAYDNCKEYVLKRFSQHLTMLVDMDSEERNLGQTTDEGETFVDMQKAYGFLLSACKLKEMPPPEDVSNRN